MILARVSPVTHSIGNCVKRVIVIVASVIVFRNPVTTQNAIGAAGWRGREEGPGGCGGLGGKGGETGECSTVISHAYGATLVRAPHPRGRHKP